MLTNPYGGISLSKEIHRKSWWELELTSPGGSMPGEQYEIRTVPELASRLASQGHITVNSKQNYPHHKEASGCLVLEFVSYEGGKILEFFKTWQKLVYDPDTDEVGLYSDVVGQGTLKLYVPQGGSEASSPVLDRSIKLIDVWPMVVAFCGVDRENEGEPAKFTVTLEMADVSL